jgi:branched-subunit amino acid ABC-type transport system permease component
MLLLMAFFPLNANLTSHFVLAVILACKLILFTIGLNMVYSVLKFSNFAHAEFITFGMYTSWWGLQMIAFASPLLADFFNQNGIQLLATFFTDSGHLLDNVFIHAAFAFFMGGVLGIIGEILIFSRLRGRAATATAFTVASIGLGIIIRNVLSMVFTDFPDKRGTFNELCPNCTFLPNLPGPLADLFSLIPFYNVSQGQFIINILPETTLWSAQTIRVTNLDLIIVIIAIITVFAIDFLFRKTKFGIAMRATSDSQELAQVSGINTKRIILYTWFLAAGITGFGAAFVRATQPIFTSLDGALFWLLPVFAVAILGGVGSFRGGIIAAFIIAFARQATFILFTEFQRSGGLEDILNIVTFSPSYADAIGFVVLILVLLFRPQGIAGSPDATRARV